MKCRFECFLCRWSRAPPSPSLQAMNKSTRWVKDENQVAGLRWKFFQGDRQQDASSCRQTEICISQTSGRLFIHIKKHLQFYIVHVIVHHECKTVITIYDVLGSQQAISTFTSYLVDTWSNNSPTFTAFRYYQLWLDLSYEHLQGWA